MTLLTLKAFLFVFLAAVLSAANFAHAQDRIADNPLVNGSTDPNLLRDLRALAQNVRDRGCDVNLCFALQGDDYITDFEFESQKNFVDLIIAILTTDQPGNFCAVQYGRTTRAISRLTRNKNQFLNRLDRATRVGGFDTNIAAALGYTGFQLRARTEDARKLIILGDGLETIGFRPRRIARRIRSEGTRICAVAVGGFDTEALEDITGDPNLVLKIDEFFELAEIVVGLVNDVCGFFIA